MKILSPAQVREEMLSKDVSPHFRALLEQYLKLNENRYFAISRTVCASCGTIAKTVFKIPTRFPVECNTCHKKTVYLED